MNTQDESSIVDPDDIRDGIAATSLSELEKQTLLAELDTELNQGDTLSEQFRQKLYALWERSEAEQQQINADALAQEKFYRAAAFDAAVPDADADPGEGDRLVEELEQRSGELIGELNGKERAKLQQEEASKKKTEDAKGMEDAYAMLKKKPE